MNKLGIIGGSGLYDLSNVDSYEWIDINTPWGKPSDSILKCTITDKIIYFQLDIIEIIIYHLQILIIARILIHLNN